MTDRNEWSVKMDHMIQEISPFVSHYGLWIVFFGMMIEGTTMILISGILCYLGFLSVTETMPVAIFGAIVGDQFWYFLGKTYTRKVLERFPSFRQSIEKLSNNVKKKGNLMAFGSRFVYSGAIIFPLALGVYGYPYKKFTLFDVIGVTLWAAVGISIGYFLGTGAEQLFGEIKKIEYLLLFIAFVSIVVWGVQRYMKFKKENG